MTPERRQEIRQLATKPLLPTPQVLQAHIHKLEGAVEEALQHIETLEQQLSATRKSAEATIAKLAEAGIKIETLERERDELKAAVAQYPTKADLQRTIDEAVSGESAALFRAEQAEALVRQAFEEGYRAGWQAIDGEEPEPLDDYPWDASVSKRTLEGGR